MAQEFRFKTSLNCGNCVAKVKKNLDNLLGENEWKVDTDNPDKVLSINETEVNEQQIIDAVEAIGFDIEKI